MSDTCRNYCRKISKYKHACRPQTCCKKCARRSSAVAEKQPIIRHCLE